MQEYAYEAVLTPSEEGGYDVIVPDLPGCFTCGDDYQDAIKMAADAIESYVSILVEDGRDIPVRSPVEVNAPSVAVEIRFALDCG